MGKGLYRIPMEKEEKVFVAQSSGRLAAPMPV
jgi:hypothetical protein